LSDFRVHLKKIKDAKIEWIRMDVKTQSSHSETVFRKAHDLGLKVIGVITIKRMLRNQGWAKKRYFPGSSWGKIWKAQVQKAVKILGPFVDIWQIDNELNHPWHNFLPSINKRLAVDIVKTGAETVKAFDSQAQVAVNLFYRKELPIPRFYYPRNKPLIFKYRDKIQDNIDILGMDIFRGSWHRGTPDIYPQDLEFYRDLWKGDIMIMETGYCTSAKRTEADQVEHVKMVFQSLDPYIKNVPWFKGLIWYEYHSSHSKIPCESFFGLHKKDGVKEKLAWGEFVKCVEKYRSYNKIFGVAYHY
jgi:hypothetical protein